MSAKPDRATVRARAAELVRPGINRRVALICAYAELAGDPLDPEVRDDAAVILRSERLLLDGLAVDAALAVARGEMIAWAEA